MRPIQFIETAQTCQNPTLTTTGIGWYVKTHFNWFDKMVNITKFKAKPPSMLGCRIEKFTQGTRKCLDQQNISKSPLGF